MRLNKLKYMSISYCYQMKAEQNFVHSKRFSIFTCFTYAQYKHLKSRKVKTVETLVRYNNSITQSNIFCVNDFKPWLLYNFITNVW